MTENDSKGRWTVTNEELFADPDFAYSADAFGPYDVFDFTAQVQTVADRLFNLHLERDVNGAFIFGFDCNADGEIGGGNVAVALPGEWSLYLTVYLDAKRWTDNREVTGRAQASAIASALMDCYAVARRRALESGLLH